MPNWSYNRIAVKGTKQNLIAWLNKGLANDKREPLTENMSCAEISDILNKKQLTLESFIPMPQTYHDYDTTNSVNNTLMWLNGLLYNGVAKKTIQKHFNKWLYDYFGYDNTNMRGVGISRLKKLAFKHKTQFIRCTQTYLLEVAEKNDELMKEINAEHNKYVEGYYAAKVYQEETYGVVGWYDWHCKNFGCKWNCEFYNVETKEIGGDQCVIYFKCDTPWNVPMEWLKTMQEENKETLIFYCRSNEESGLWNGYFCCLEETWREDHEYEFSHIEDDEERWQAEEELNAAIDRRFEDDVECMFETIETA